MKARWTAAAALAVFGSHLLHAHTFDERDRRVHVNQIQVVGSHNSYNLGFAPSEAKFLEQRNPKAYRSLEYSHAPMPAQLDSGVRQLEIDIVQDQKGGRFAHPKIVEMTKAAGLLWIRISISITRWIGPASR